MKLSKWAKLQGIDYRTAWSWFKNNTMPVKSYQTSTGTIIVEETLNVKENNNEVDIYCRVSSSNKKLDLDNQSKLCEEYCIANGYKIKKSIREIASGMNDNRPKLNSILDSPSHKLVVLYKDRLTRFGFNYIEKLLKSKGCELVVINQNKTEEEDLLKDFIAIITSFCCRMYGARRGQSKALKMKQELKND
jgi:predicted site-specific integrase-resolvase